LLCYMLLKTGRKQWALPNNPKHPIHMLLQHILYKLQAPV
jgi:hypothetical protein